MSFSNRTSQALLNSLFGKSSNFGALASAPAIHVGLSSTTPTASGGNVTEPGDGGYARVEAVAADWGSATDADPSVITNAEEIDFGTASGTWLTGDNLTHAVFYDAASGGNFLGHGVLAVPKPVFNGDPVKFGVGTITFSLT